MLKLMGKKIFTILRSKVLFILTCALYTHVQRKSSCTKLFPCQRQLLLSADNDCTLDSDQAQQNVRLDRDLNYFFGNYILMVQLEEFFE